MEQIFVKLLKWSIGAQEALGATGTHGGSTSGDGFNLRDISPIKNTNFVALLKSILGYAIGIAIPIAALMILVGGYQIMFAGGDPTKVQRGKSTILYTLVGLAIVILAWVFTTILKDLLGIR